MTRLLLLGAVLLLPLAGEAGDHQPITSLTTLRDDGQLQYDINGSLKIDRQSFDAMLKDYPDAKLRVTLVSDPCLATMEAAMRAMEPFSVLDLEPSWAQINLNQLTLHKGGSATLPNEEEEYDKLTPYGLTQTMNARAGLAIVLWANAKRCWTNQP